MDREDFFQQSERVFLDTSKQVRTHIGVVQKNLGKVRVDLELKQREAQDTRVLLEEKNRQIKDLKQQLSEAAKGGGRASNSKKTALQALKNLNPDNPEEFQAQIRQFIEVVDDLIKKHS